MEYKVINNGTDKKIAYPSEMSDELIEILEKARKNRTFLTITDGDIQTGQSWGDLFGAKGVLGLSRGKEYLFPILVSFKRGEYDEELDEEVGESYDFLSELNTKQISEYLDDNDLSIDDVLDSGGSILSSSIVAVRTGLKKTRVVYKHKSFKPSRNFLDYEVITEEIKTTCESFSSFTKEVKKEEKITNKYHLFIEKEKFSAHDSTDDLISFLQANLELNLIGEKVCVQI